MGALFDWTAALRLLGAAVLLFAIGYAAGCDSQRSETGKVRTEYATFVATVEAEGKAADAAAQLKINNDRKLKDEVDHAHELDIARLTADNQRLRDARTRSSYVPAAPASARDPGLACFDRAELEQALRRFDDGVTGIIGEGDAATVGLNAARAWAQRR